MIYVLTPEQMRAVDAAAIERIGANKLMRNAGRRIAKRLRTMAKPGSRIVAFAGPGNNGGDAFAALAELAREYDCTVAADPAAQGSEARNSALLSARRWRPGPFASDRVMAKDTGRTGRFEKWEICGRIAR